MRKETPENFAENRRAGFDYEIAERLEAGIELTGQEVKSVRSGRVNLAGSYVLVRNGEAWLFNADIPAYQEKNAPKDYDSDRQRRLLLHGNEIRALEGKLSDKGWNLLPLRMYERRDRIKLELGLGRSRKARDKREAIRKRESQREMRREAA